MKKYFGKETKPRTVPKCKECKSDKNVGLSTYNTGEKSVERYWECYWCNCVVGRAK